MYTPPMAVVYETESPHAIRAELGPYREADYLLLPDQPRCELLYGRLLLMPAPASSYLERYWNVIRVSSSKTSGRTKR